MPVGAASVPCWDTLDGRHSLVRGGHYATIDDTPDGRADCSYLAANPTLCGGAAEESLFHTGSGETGPNGTGSGDAGSGELGSGDSQQTFRARDVCCACGGGTSTAPPPPPLDGTPPPPPPAAPPLPLPPPPPSAVSAPRIIANARPICATSCSGKRSHVSTSACVSADSGGSWRVMADHSGSWRIMVDRGRA